MNWRGRPLTSHEVVVNTIAATITRTGLKVLAELDTGEYPAGVRVSDAQLEALPLRGHDWHGAWNYTLLPQAFSQVITPAATPFDQASPEHAWLCHLAVTGLDPAEWAALVRALGALNQDQREARLRRRRGRERTKAPGAGRPPTLTLVDRILAAFLQDRLGLPRTAIAEHFHVRCDTIGQRIRQARELLVLLGRPLEPAEVQPTSITALRVLVAQHRNRSNPAVKRRVDSLRVPDRGIGRCRRGDGLCRPAYLVFGTRAVKSRWSRSGTGVADGSGIVVRTFLRRCSPTMWNLRMTRSTRL